MANISLALYTNVFFGSALKLPIQIGTLSIDNSVRNISRLGTFKVFTNFYFVMSFLRFLCFIFYSLNMFTCMLFVYVYVYVRMHYCSRIKVILSLSSAMFTIDTLL